MSKIQLGVESFLSTPKSYAKGARLGLICNQASVDHGFRYSSDLFHGNPEVDLRAFFGPQHGIRGAVQDNMIETGHSIDRITGLPVYSLYSETRIPTSEMLEGIDAMCFDLQDIGGRVYTFIYTMAYAMKACAEAGKRFIVMDRPNPIGGTIEGNLLQKGHESFVGGYPIPMRHGMTIGELALMFNNEFGIGCDLEVIKMNGWDRSMYLDEIDAPWVMPSPNMPTVETAVVFPGTVFFEGTEVSEGRGTARPFEQVGAPYIEAEKLAKHMNSLGLEGVYFRAIEFMPTFQKFQNAQCGGVFVHVTDRRVFKPVISGIAIVKSIYELYEDEFQWKQTPYEYEFDRNPFDVIAGCLGLREMVESGTGIKRISESWEAEEKEFFEMSSKYYLYK